MNNPLIALTFSLILIAGSVLSGCNGPTNSSKPEPEVDALPPIPPAVVPLPEPAALPPIPPAEIPLPEPAPEESLDEARMEAEKMERARMAAEKKADSMEAVKMEQARLEAERMEEARLQAEGVAPTVDASRHETVTATAEEDNSSSVNIPMATEAPADVCPLAASDLPEFSWPPPEPSGKVTIPQRLLLGGDAPGSQSLSAIAGKLEIALGAAQYREYAYHVIACDGFALITRLERIDESGKPLDGPERWSPPGKNVSWSLKSYLARLFYSPPGYYRQIIFAVTDEPYNKIDTGAAPTLGELEDLLDEGQPSMPEVADEIMFTRQHQLHALIYEFKKGQSDEEVSLLNPSRHTGSDHLEAVGIYSSLELDE